MLFLISLGIFIVVGFHVLLKFLDYGKSALSTNIHPIRRLQHILTGLIIAAIYSFVSHETGKIMITVPALLFFTFDVVRRKNHSVNSWFLHHWGKLLRPHERFDSPPGACFFLMGIAAVFWISDDRAVTNLSIFYVSLCDPAASVVGILFGSVKITKKKSAEGSLAAAAVGGGISVAVGTAFGRDFGFFWGFLVGLVAEVSEVPFLDDNFSIPVLCCVMWERLKSLSVA